jgi:hypothetical protein
VFICGNVKSMSHVVLRKITIAIFLITLLVTGQGNKADASFLIEKASVSRCVPASVPFVSVKKPWKLVSKKCDRAKSQELFTEFSEFEFIVEFPPNPSPASSAPRLNPLLRTFLQSINTKKGWRKPITGCDPTPNDYFFQCDFTVTRVDRATKQVQLAYVSAFFVGNPPYEMAFIITVTVDNQVSAH